MFFRGGSVMDPAIWNQNGIDSGAESPESESIFSTYPESQSESIPHGNALLETESELAPVFFSGIGIDFSQLGSSTSRSHTIRKMRNEYHLFKCCADLISV